MPNRSETQPSQQPTTLIPLPNGGKIRTTPEGKISVFDFIREATGAKTPKMTWVSISATYPEVVKFCDHFLFKKGRGQRPTPVVGKEGYLRILHLLGGKVGQAFREACDSLVLRYLDGDPTLAAEVLDRNPNPEQALTWLNKRQETKQTNRALNQTIRDHNGTCFTDVAILTCKAATGKSPAGLRKLRGGNEARDTMNVGELCAVGLTEALTRTAIENTNVQGNPKIFSQSLEVAKAVADLRKRFGGTAFHENPAIATPKVFTPTPSPQLALL